VLAAVPDPHASWTQLPLSNGRAAAVFDAARARLVSLREHVYAHADAASTTRELLHDAYFGLRAAGQNAWLAESPVDAVGWDGDAAIVRLEQHLGDLRAVQYFFAPSGVEAPVVVAVVEVSNTGTAPASDAALFSLHNLHVGGGSDGTS